MLSSVQMQAELTVVALKELTVWWACRDNGEKSLLPPHNQTITPTLQVRTPLTLGGRYMGINLPHFLLWFLVEILSNKMSGTEIEKSSFKSGDKREEETF